MALDIISNDRFFFFNSIVETIRLIHCNSMVESFETDTVPPPHPVQPQHANIQNATTTTTTTTTTTHRSSSISRKKRRKQIIKLVFFGAFFMALSVSIVLFLVYADQIFLGIQYVIDEVGVDPANTLHIFIMWYQYIILYIPVYIYTVYI